MAYVLGFFAADGNIVITNRNTHFLSFYTLDKELIFSIRTALESNHKITKRKYKNGHCYRVQIGSKEMFEDLVCIGMTPNKAKRMLIPSIPHKYYGDFIRGYFDGDGNIWSGLNNKKRKIPSVVLRAAFTSGSKDFLFGLHKLIKAEGIVGGNLYFSKKHNFSRLTFSTYDTLKLYQIMYNNPHRLCLKRKKRVFEKFIKLRS